MPLGTISGMGERSRILRDKRRKRLFAFVAAACLVLFGALLVGINVQGTSGERERAGAPDLSTGTGELQKAAVQEAAFVASARKAAAEEAARQQEATKRQDAVKQRDAAQRTEQRVARPAPESHSQAAIPSDTTMYLTIPKLGLYNIPVLEGTSEAVLSQGVGHVPGTGYPWIPGSNTYIAGHRLGYPGTISDHVFWGLPSLVRGDQVILKDSLGQSYTYEVSDILEVAPSDLDVTGTTGTDMVSLQTCIENYGDYWTAGPDWFVRYIVRAYRVT